MSIVMLNRYVTGEIVYNAREVVRRSLPSPKPVPAIAPIGVGDEAYSLLLPEDYEKQICDLMPDWALQYMDCMHIGVVPPGTDLYNPSRFRSVLYTPTYVVAEFKKPHISLPSGTTIRNVQGIDEARWGGGALVIKPTTDGKDIKQPALRDFVCELLSTEQQAIDNVAAVNKAADDMTKFLSQYRTLQQAVKAFGPALLEFVPLHIREAYDRVPVKRAKKEKKEKVEVDVDYLVAKAVANRLQLNA